MPDVGNGVFKFFFLLWSPYGFETHANERNTLTIAWNLKDSDDGVQNSESQGSWSGKYLESRTMDKVHKPSDSKD
jgi:hypothetical protein